MEAKRFSPTRCGSVSCSTVCAGPHGVAVVFFRLVVAVAMAGNVAGELSRVCHARVSEACRRTAGSEARRERWGRTHLT